MSTIKHREIDIYDCMKENYVDYYVEQGASVNELHIRYDNDFECMAWVFSEQPQRMHVFQSCRKVCINLFDPFREGYRIKV